MLAHSLAIALWLGSVALYGAAFFFPEVHRRHDFFWSGVAAFYGLVLWFDAVQISPIELLGHGASLALLGWFGWQTLSLRRKRTPLDLQTPLTAESWPAFWENLRRSLQGSAKATPLGRWLPEDWEKPGLSDPVIAVSEIRVSSLKDVDYEFVDELGPMGDTKAVGAESAPVIRPPATVPPKSPPAQPHPAPSPQPAPPLQPSPSVPVGKAKPEGPSARVAGLRAWLAGWFKAKPAAPKREVIEIPPRPSPLDRKQSKRDIPQQDMTDIPPRPSPLDRKQPKREVIDIPPRPSPLDRYKNKPADGDSTPAETVTIVDATAVESSGAIASEPAVTPPPPPDQATPGPPTDSPAEPPESNWDDDDSNWLDD